MPNNNDSQEMKVQSKQKDPLWIRFILSNTAAALVTTIVGGLAVQLVVWGVQQAHRDRERDRIAVEVQIARQQRIVERGFTLVEQCIASSQNLIVLTQPAYQLRDKSAGNLERLIAQRADYRQEFNRVDRKWKSERETLGLRMTLYHNDNGGVKDAWREVEKAATAYLACAERAYITYLDGAKVPADVCQDSEELLRQGLHGLTTSLQQAQDKTLTDFSLTR